MNDNNTDTLAQEVTLFFRNFALDVLRKAHVDPNDPRAFKLAMLEHYEEVYPHFSLTPTFQAHFQKARHQEMVEEYKRCFNLLLLGHLP